MDTPQSLLTVAELAARPDFELGATVVSPSMRTVRGPGGTADVEPRVMQVLVVLSDAANHVVTREALFSRCWGGVYVGDDSLNRAVAAVRRIAQDVAAGSFEIETIPRTGYRLSVAERDDAGPAGEASVRPPRFTRRAAIGGGLVAAAAVAGGVGLWSARSEQRRQFEQLIDRGERALDYGDPSLNAAPFLERALAIRPDDVKARAMLAYGLAFSAEYGGPGEASSVDQIERSARAILAENPDEPHARLALILIERSTLDIS